MSRRAVAIKAAVTCGVAQISTCSEDKGGVSLLSRKRATG